MVGIGINVHQRASIPIWPTPATSLDLEAGRRVSRQDLLVFLLESLEREALGLADPAAGVTIPARVEQASTWIRGRRVEVHGPQACTGVTAGLDEHGFLLVRTEDWIGDRADRRNSRHLRWGTTPSAGRIEKLRRFPSRKMSKTQVLRLPFAALRSLRMTAARVGRTAVEVRGFPPIAKCAMDGAPGIRAAS